MRQFFKGEDGNYFRIKGGNREIQATSESYTRPSDAKRGYGDLLDTIVRDDLDEVLSRLSAQDLFRELVRRHLAGILVVDEAPF